MKTRVLNYQNLLADKFVLLLPLSLVFYSTFAALLLFVIVPNAFAETADTNEDPPSQSPTKIERSLASFSNQDLAEKAQKKQYLGGGDEDDLQVQTTLKNPPRKMGPFSEFEDTQKSNNDGH